MRLIDADALYDKAEMWYKGARAPFREIYRSLVDAVADAPTIEPPPNDPLTLEELREMDGEPVWCINGNGGQWGLIHVFSAGEETYVECVTKTGFTMDGMTYGAMGVYDWLVYRRKPEDKT